MKAMRFLIHRLLIFGFIPAGLTVGWGATLSLGAGSAAPGTTASLPISFSGLGSQVSALEFTISYSTADFTNISLSLGSSGSSASKTLGCNSNANGQYSCLISGMNQNLISDGVVGTVVLAVSSSTASASSAVSIVTALGSGPNGTSQAITGSGSTVAISGAPISGAPIGGVPIGGASQWTDLSGWFSGKVAIGVNKDGRLEAFVRGSDTALWHKWQTTAGGSWTGWSPLGGLFISDPVVATNADGRLEVFAVGTDGGLWHVWQYSPGGSWSGWSGLGGGIQSDPSVVLNADGRVEVFVRGTDNSLWHVWQVAPGGNWSAWSGLGG